MKRLTLAILFLALVAPGAARAQNGSSNAELRGVSGTILDKDEHPVDAAVVYLKNVRALTVRTYITNDKGEYHFSGLDPNADYELHAEHGDLTSPNHTVSSLDSRKELVVTLKINKEKEKKKIEK
jgi:hypothetical protein